MALSSVPCLHSASATSSWSLHRQVGRGAALHSVCYLSLGSILEPCPELHFFAVVLHQRSILPLEYHIRSATFCMMLTNPDALETRAGGGREGDVWFSICHTAIWETALFVRTNIQSVCMDAHTHALHSMITGMRWFSRVRGDWSFLVYYQLRSAYP